MVFLIKKAKKVKKPVVKVKRIYVLRNKETQKKKALMRELGVGGKTLRRMKIKAKRIDREAKAKLAVVDA